MNYTFLCLNYGMSHFALLKKRPTEKYAFHFKDKCFKALFWVNLIMNHQSCKYLCMPIYRNGYFCKKSI